MELIIGGAYQGKELYARSKFPDMHWVNGMEADLEDVLHAEGILHFERFIRKELEAGRDVSSLGEALIQNAPGVVIVSEEVGYGIVPMDPLDRSYREAVGRICTKLALNSSRVTRIVCGIGMVIKGD
ncbi:MAG: bifunctional adenosylcobinamide kinase/adenosylcobinamide-phosphate guanylyltransferase [Eubacteriales bacterium]|nr:bifunctional adenosylcobinamide kinase/adenosylcobinamide-phosphate guanylyltransferase [Eubacteriales bacterium]